MMKILAVDIGNTRTHFALMHGLRVKRIYSRIPALKKGSYTAVIASVVPSASAALARNLRKRGWRVYEIGKDLPVPIKNRCRPPGQTGVDRLLNALAAHARYKKPVIVVDFGTAITVDAVSAKGEFLGGAIAPGLETCLWALHARTAKLPLVVPSRGRRIPIIGKSTTAAILAGCVAGFGGLCDRIIRDMQNRLPGKALVVATGGGAKILVPYCRTVRRIHDQLTLEGIALAFSSTKKIS